MKPTNSHPHRVLVADDQSDIRDALRLLLRREGYEIHGAASPSEALAALEAREFDAVLMDLNYARDTTSGQEGLDLLSRIQMVDSTLPLIVMTAWSSVEVAVEAMRRGARDFIPKPWENNRLLAILRTQIDLRQALRQASRLEAENRLLRAESRPTMIAESEAMRPVLDIIGRIGVSDANVLITGEHGTGKEVVAQTLHTLSPRASTPMVTVNAGGLSEGVFESELFGHVKGAFTDARVDRVGRFELADNGTLFLDEIANVPLKLQAKLLRVYAQPYRKTISGFDPVATQVLHEHPWPGNVRELDHAIERGVLLATGPLVRAGDLGLRAAAPGSGARLEEMSLDEVEHHLIQRMLARHDGNVSQTAKALDRSRSAMYRRLQKHGLE